MVTALFLCAALASGGTPLPPVIVTQTQFYPWREPARGYLGRYCNQPLLVDPDLPDDPDRTDIPEFPNWGNFHSQADYDFTMAQIKAMGLDGATVFTARPARFFTAARACPVSDVGVAPILFDGRMTDDQYVAQVRKATLDNPRAIRLRGRYLLPTYWTSKFNTPSDLVRRYALVREKLGDRFIFFASMPVLAKEWVRFELNGRKFVPGARDELKGIVRDYLRAADGIQLSEAHMLAKVENDEKVFAREYWDELHALTREVMDEPEFGGRKLLGSAAVNAHMNAYRGTVEVAENGTRSLRDSFEVALKHKADFINLPEFDEFNENTCFEPTLYGSYAVKRIVRHYVARAKGLPQSALPGDDTSLPNLIVSYRKSLSPGELLKVEVLNVPDGSRTGALDVAVELADEAGATVRRFDAVRLEESELAERRFPFDTAATAARALQVRLACRTADGSRRTWTAFHPVDLVPRAEWNHLCCKQPIRDLARLATSDVTVADGRMKASFAAAEGNIRYAMLCGNGCIQVIRGKPGSAPDLFREDADHAVFQITARRLGPNLGSRSRGDCRFEVPGVEDAEWLYMKKYGRGATFRFPKLRGDDKSSPFYVRLPKGKVSGAKLRVDFESGAWSGEVDLGTAFREGSFSLGDNGWEMQLTVTRFDLQAQYPSVADAREVSFDVPLAKDCGSVLYHAQVVMMDGRTWFSRPFVVEDAGGAAKATVWSTAQRKAVTVELPAARLPTLAWDFSPRAGNVVPSADGYRHWNGMLGGPFTPATLWNRGCLTEGFRGWEGPEFKDKNRVGVPKRVREPDGSWSLEFDGVDDFAVFPYNSIPQFSGFAASFDVYPYARTDGKGGALLSSFGSLGSVGLTKKGALELRFSELPTRGEAKTQFREGLLTDKWTHVDVVSDCETLRLFLDGRPVGRPLEVRYPSEATSSLALGGYSRGGWTLGFFKGRIRNLRIAPRPVK